MNCILCGISRQHTTELSHHTAKSITDLIQQRCSRGPLVYPTIMEWDQPTVCACRLCFHQLKRRSKGVMPKKQPLPLDATLLQALIPGNMRQQDSRTRERICAALRTPGNSYSKSFEALSRLLPPTEDCQQQATLLRDWWNYNLRTEFFAHKTTAKLARKAALS